MLERRPFGGKGGGEKEGETNGNGNGREVIRVVEKQM